MLEEQYVETLRRIIDLNAECHKILDELKATLDALKAKESK